MCKKDQGGRHKYKNKWTTFMKTRLNCSVPGNMPFFFNEIQSTTSGMVSDNSGKDKLIYGVFTTPDNSIAGSAVCSFRLSEIQAAFNGDFKGQQNANSNWLPIRDTNLPDPETGKFD